MPAPIALDRYPPLKINIRNVLPLHTMDAGARSAKRYGVVVLVSLLIAAIAVPLVDGLTVTGFLGEKTYLLVLQDNDEIMPTGGLMACFAVVTVQGANIKDLDMYYARTDPQLNRSVRIEGPESVTTFFDVETVALFASNVQYDFASHAPILQKDFYKATGRAIDGIITVDFTAVKEVMNILGPVTTSGETLTSDNVVGRLHYYSSVSTGEKTPLTGRLRAFALTLWQDIRDASLPNKLALVTAFERLGVEGHIQCYLKNDMLLQNFNGAREQSTGDFVAVSDLSMGVAKADFGVNRTVDYDVTIQPDGSAISNLTLTYANDNWWGYNVLNTALVPPNATLLRVAYTTDTLDGPAGKHDANSTAFISQFLISGNQTGNVTYTYKLPTAVSKSEGVGTRYDLDVHKQAGIERYTVRADVHVPQGTHVMAAHNVGTTMTYTRDMHAFVVYA